MAVTPRVFVSAASGDLASARKVINEALVQLGCLPVEQSISGTDYGRIRELLKRWIDPCQALIHVVGPYCGGEPDPDTLPPGQPRRSWTQFEYDYAIEQKQKLYVLVCEDSFPFDTPAKPEPADKTELQAAHRQAVLDGDYLWNTVRDLKQLRQRILELKLPLDEVRSELRSRQVRHRLQIGMGAVAIVLLVGAAIFGFSQLSKKVDELPDEVSKVYQDPDVLAGKLKKHIREKAAEEIKQAEKDWRKIVEIEERRDRELERVDQLVDTIRKGLAGDPDPVFAQAAQILAEEGVDAALEYLELKRARTLEKVDKINDLQRGSEEAKRKLLGNILLEADLLSADLQWEKALDLCKKVVDRAKNWGLARRALAMLHSQLSEHEEAEKQLRVALELTDDSKEKALVLNDLANLLQATDRLAEAEPHYLRALAIQEEQEGPSHHNVAITLNNLARLFQATNRIELAKPLYLRALGIFDEHYDIQHAGILQSLSLLLRETGRLPEAESLARNALAIHEKAQNGQAFNQAEVARDLHSLAAVLMMNDRAEEAKSLLLRTLAIQEKIHSPDHPEVATTLSDLGLLLRNNGNLKQAEPLMRRALKINEQAYGPLHGFAGTNLNNLAQLLLASDRPVEALPLMRRTITIYRNSYGADHPSFANALGNFAQAFHDANSPEQAALFYRHSLAIYEKSDQSKQRDVAACLNRLAELLTNNQRDLEAELLLRRSLALKEKFSGTAYLGVATDLTLLAHCLQRTKRDAEAELLFRRALAIDQISYQINPAPVADNLVNLARLFQATGRHAEAEPLFRGSLAIYKRLRGEEHPDVALRLWDLANVASGTNRLTAARSLMQRSVAILCRFSDEQGNAHPQRDSAVQVYRGLLVQSGMPEDEVRQLIGTAENNDESLPPLGPLTDDLLGPTPTVQEVLADLQRQVEQQGEPIARFLDLNKPVSTLLSEQFALWNSVNARGVYCASLGRYLEALVHYERALEMSQTELEKFGARVNVASARIGLGEEEQIDQARATLLELSKQTKQLKMPSFVVGRILYHQARCERHLGNQPKARQLAEQSAQVYASGPVPTASWQFTYETQQLLNDLKKSKPLPEPLAFDVATNLNPAREHVQAMADFAELRLDQPASGLLDKLFGPRATIDDIIAQLEVEFRRRGPSEIWTLGSDKSITPHLLELIGPNELETKIDQPVAEEVIKRLGPMKLDVPVNQPITEHLDKTLGPARPTRDVLDALDAEYKKQTAPPLSIPPLDQPISPQLNKLPDELPTDFRN